MEKRPRLRSATAPLLLVCGVITAFWKLALTKQYTILENYDLANQVMPWLQAEIYAIRHGWLMLWDPYEWVGQSLIGQVQPAVVSPFTFLLAAAPLHHGYIQPFYIHQWFVLIHICAALFAYWLFRDLGCRPGAAAVGGLFYAIAGFCGNTGWPQHLAPAIWAPLVFLFMLRMLRGRTPMKSAAWAGVALGVSWLSGHHEPAFLLTLTVAGVALASMFWPGNRFERARNLAILFVVMGLVSAVQVLPAREYGKVAKRWTETGALTWKDKVAYPEHENSGLLPEDLYHVLMPGGSGLRSDPFVGVVGLSLAAIAILGAFGRREVRLFAVVAICALLYAISRNNPLYGVLYSLVPLVEKSRAPIVALSIFHFSVAVLAAFGADLVFSRTVTKTVAWFGALVVAFFVIAPYVHPVPDPRVLMTGLVALLLAAVFHCAAREYIRVPWVFALIGVLLILEQGNETGWNFAYRKDEKHATFLKQLYDNEDIGKYLQWLPSPKRIEVNDDDTGLKFSAGDWWRVDAVHAASASMLAATSELGWWQDRLVRMFAVTHVVSRNQTRPGQQALFTGRTGIKIWANTDVYPRAWAVHQIVVAPNDWNGADMVREWPFDLRTTALMVGEHPKLEQCAAPDVVGKADERPSSVTVPVDMACKGLLVVSDNWYPGWNAEVDGKSARIWRVNTVIRGVVVEKGRHTVTMKYRPMSVYLGALCLLIGLAGAVVLQRRPED